MMCSFCRKNGEQAEYYTSHRLKDENNQVTCPVLKEFVCPLCQVKGEHTVGYCPLKKGNKMTLGRKKAPYPEFTSYPDDRFMLMHKLAELAEKLIKHYVAEMMASMPSYS